MLSGVGNHSRLGRGDNMILSHHAQLYQSAATQSLFWQQQVSVMRMPLLALRLSEWAK